MYAERKRSVNPTAQRPGLRARLHSSEEPIDALAVFASDYAATIALAGELNRADARRVLHKAQGRYSRLLPEAVTSATWLTDEPAP